MSLNVNKDNIYFISPFSKYGGHDSIDTFMEKGFTISTRIKINKENLPTQMDAFMFARNGKHSGILVYLDVNNKLEVRFCYWFTDENGNDVLKKIVYYLPEELEDKFNDYYITDDHTNKMMSFYLNGNKIGDIDYINLKKCDYTGAFIWLGCGNMLNDDQFNGIGDFEYEYIYCLDKELKFHDVMEINKNYKTKYLKFDPENSLPILNEDIKDRENFRIFCDFDYKNMYKVWNMADGINFFQFYIDNNMIY